MAGKKPEKVFDLQYQFRLRTAAKIGIFLINPLTQFIYFKVPKLNLLSKIH